MEAIEIEPWLFRVEPLEGESLSHFLGRFRRANELTPTGLGKMARLGGAIARWEKFRFNPPPSLQQLDALAVVVGVEGHRLQEMLPPPGVGMKLEPIRREFDGVPSPQPWLTLTGFATSYKFLILIEISDEGKTFI